MAPEHKPSRTKPGIRHEQVALTERRVLEAASALFVERGYVGTSLLAVAEAAGVAPRTVYVRFGSKAQLLGRCIDTSIVGDTQPVALLDRDLAKPSLEGATLEERIDGLVALSRAVMERSAALFAVATQAAAIEPEIAAMERAGMQQTLGDFRVLAERLAADRLLPEGMSADAVTDLLWVLTGPRTLVSLQADRGWTPDRFAAWLESVLRSFLRPR
ncbi:MAG: helix-turn-helix domain-containing protein [Candidatus Dormibacter sp.]